MKIVFVENRYKTFFWEAIASLLVAEGFEISWIVQNPQMKPNLGRVYTIPFPKKNDLMQLPDVDSLQFIKSTDRFINYFGGNDLHYAYYWKKIGEILQGISPDIVIGESTLFHELMVISWCKNNDVPYFHPTSPGYPAGRSTFYEYDSKKPVWNSGEVPTEKQCLEFAEDVTKRKVLPDYMRKHSVKLSTGKYPLPGSFRDKINILKGYLSGERYNTPNPLRKILLDQAVKKILAEWEELAEKRSGYEKGKNILLYPLHMQPEANIDVWGNKYRDQAGLIARLADSLPQGWILLVKLNPKAKYELSKELIESIRSRKNIIPAQMSRTMGEIFNEINLLVTIAGTVAIEAVLLGIPVVALGPTITCRFEGCQKVSSPESVGEIIQLVEGNDFLLATTLQRIELVKELFRTSFLGVVSDPCHMASVLDAENIKNVTEALMKVTKAVS